MDSPSPSKARLIVASVVPAVSAGPMVYLCILGTPATVVTWLILAIPIVVGCFTAHRLVTAERFPKWMVVLLLILIGYPIYYVEVANVVIWRDLYSRDTAIGDPNWIFLRIANPDSVQSAMVRRYCPNRPPYWIGLTLRKTRTEEPNCCQFRLLTSKWLPRLYVLLPNEEARRQVFECLFDMKNCAAGNQAQLIACLVKFGLPDGETPATWWQTHSCFFQSQHDPKKAAEFWFGWHPRVVALMSSGKRAVDDSVSGAVGSFLAATPSPDRRVSASYRRALEQLLYETSKLPRNERIQAHESAPTSGVEW